MIHSFVRILFSAPFSPHSNTTESEADNWSDEEDFFSSDEQPARPADLPTVLCRIELLEMKPAQSHQDMAEYRALVGQRFDAGRSAKIVNEAGSPSSAGPTQRDYDTHYFCTIAKTVRKPPYSLYI
jgi:hypothetical protein